MDHSEMTRLIGEVIGQDRRFAAIIAQEAARFPVRDFLEAGTFQDYSAGNLGQAELEVFQRYNELIRPEDEGEALLLLNYWYRFIDCLGPDGVVPDPLAAYPLLDALVRPYLDRASFREGLFAVGGENPENPEERLFYRQEFLVHYLALKKNLQLSENELGLLRTLLRKDGVLGHKPAQYLCELLVSAGIDGKEAEAFYEKARRETGDRGFCFRLKKLCWQKTASKIDEAFFASLPLDLLVYAVKEGGLAAGKLGPLAAEQLIKDHGDRQGMFRELRDAIPQLSPENQSDFFGFFCRRAEEETEGLDDLHLFLEFHAWLPGPVQDFLSSSPGKEEQIVLRCGKLLGKFRNDPDNPALFSAAVSALWFLSRFRAYWKALNPFLIAFRNSRAIFLEGDLRPKAGALADEIARLFHSRDQEKLRQLRRDMADSFADRLKPAKQGRNGEAYTAFERKQKGFDLSLAEPNPFWRYAYIRALADLGVAADEKGHSFKETLKAVADKDPSPLVRGAAARAIKKLDMLREGIVGKNHRKRLYQAFWWLRQASMLSRGQKIDEKAARDLRIQEGRRGAGC
ncbi:MAG: hypothetical protein LBQ46_01485 [Treponema sp.]|nr:hypothetical protein [Treponema sp.]